MTARPFTLVALGAVAVLSACNDPSSVDSPYIVTPVTSATLSGTPGWTLTDTLVVEVRDFDGNLVPGAKVTWSLPNGGRLAVQLADADDPMHGTADDHGRNYAVWTLGLNEGTQVAKVAAGFEEPVTFTASATALHVVQVSVGNNHVCAVLADLRPICWGENKFGQLGTGDTVPRDTPVTPLGLSAVNEVAAGAWTTCARDLSNDVWCWGLNQEGEAGPAADPVQLTPVRVPGTEGATSLAMGGSFGFFTCAVIEGIGGKCWGRNSQGQLGTGDSVSSSAPRQIVGGAQFVKIAATMDRACAVTTTQELWCWGNASREELSPFPSGIYATPIQPLPDQRLFDAQLTWSANCGLAIAGQLLCWGNGFFEGLGVDVLGGVTDRGPVAVTPDNSFAQVVSDRAALVLARTRSGEVFYWGTSPACCDHRKTITRLEIPVRAAQVAVGEDGYCVIDESAVLYCERGTSWFETGRGQPKAFPPP